MKDPFEELLLLAQSVESAFDCTRKDRMNCIRSALESLTVEIKNHCILPVSASKIEWDCESVDSFDDLDPGQAIWVKGGSTEAVVVRNTNGKTV